MKVVATFVSLIAFSGVVLAQEPTPSLTTLDETYGFRGARFETAPSAYRDLALAEKAGKTSYYRRKGEQKQFGTGEVADVTYGFYQGRLAVILVKTRGLHNSRAVLEALQAQAGPGVQSSPYIQRYAWNGQKVHMSYDENAMSNDALIVLTCKKLKEQEMKQALRSTPQAPPAGT
ncbi:hypothetical protein [Hymenobacter sp. AT01-02]|uniref:hypothetical protein n=1 Tax=Hymenobacter sp. AT01-02 TaxID=1571877 RepID=UPI000B063AAD|nr:hypothetical protein [Hymenobacter sp. AT01-02]